jgi:hypothetical protein
MIDNENAGDTKSTIKEIIRLATLAPSGHNTQPWHFSVNEHVITILPDYSRRLPVVDPDDHALFISLGCALENLVIAAGQYGYSTDIKYALENANSEQIEVALKKSDGFRGSALFKAIPQRQATRQQFNGEPIAEKDLQALNTASSQEGVIFKIFTEATEIEPFIEFVKEGNRIQFKNKQFVDELVSWIRFSQSDAERLRDGLRSAVMGAPSIPQWLGRIIMKLASPEKEAKKCEKSIMSSSGLMLFIAMNNDKLSWINLGRSFERVVLSATLLNIKHAHLNMPCEEISVRQKLQKHLGLNNEQPLLLLRIGYADFMPKSFRRPVEDVLKTDL